MNRKEGDSSCSHGSTEGSVRVDPPPLGALPPNAFTAAKPLDEAADGARDFGHLVIGEARERRAVGAARSFRLNLGHSSVHARPDVLANRISGELELLVKRIRERFPPLPERIDEPGAQRGERLVRAGDLELLEHAMREEPGLQR
jgi:hypothetical protein